MIVIVVRGLRGLKSIFLLMIEILHDLVYQNVANTPGTMVVGYILGRPGYLSSTAVYWGGCWGPGFLETSTWAAGRPAAYYGLLGPLMLLPVPRLLWVGSNPKD